MYYICDFVYLHLKNFTKILESTLVYLINVQDGIKRAGCKIEPILRFLKFQHLAEFSNLHVLFHPARLLDRVE